jgi:hypothetical protein
MAEDLVKTPAEEDPDESLMPGDAPPYQSRFQLLFGVLLGIGMAAVVAAVLAIAGGRKGAFTADQIAWAPWHPTTSDGQKALQQIADHVGGQYTLPSGDQLVGVRGGPLELAHLPVTIALENQGQVRILDNTNGVLFNLCGLGPNCSIKEGKPTVARSLVLRRESLELALYTFRYIKNIDQVVAILPPKKGDKPGFAMFYRRQDVGASLDRPLAATLPGQPPVPPHLTKIERNFLDNLTAPNLFQFTPQEGGDAHVYLVLTRAEG